MENSSNYTTAKLSWWRYLLGLLGVILATQIGTIPYYAYLYWKKYDLGISNAEFQETLSTLNFSILQIDDVTMLFMFLMVFVITLACFVMITPLLHNVPFKFFITSRHSYDWKRSVNSFIIWFILIGILVFIFLPPENYDYRFDLNKFVILLAVAALLIPVQSASEEIIFRGYLLTGILKATKSNFVTLVITSSLFAVAHSLNPEFSNNGFWPLFWFYFAAAFAFGAFAIIDKGLEISIGAHTAFNLFMIIVMSTSDGTIRTPSIYQTTSTDLLEVLPYVLFFAVDISVVYFFIKYKWYKKFEQILSNTD